MARADTDFRLESVAEYTESAWKSLTVKSLRMGWHGHSFGNAPGAGRSDAEETMRCPICRGLGRLEGEDYSIACWYCNSTGLLSWERLQWCKERVGKAVGVKGGRLPKEDTDAPS